MNDQMQRASKTFFQKPEGKTGMLFILVAAVGAAYGLNIILPFLITLAANTLTLALLCGAIVGLFMLVTNPRVRTLASYAFKSAMRALTGLVIEMDPIGILRGYADDLRKKLHDMERSMADLDGHVRKLTDTINKNEQQREHSLRTAQQAHKQGVKQAFVLQSRKAGRLEKSNLTLQALLEKMKGMRRVLQKMHETSDFMVQDMESEIEVKAQERAAILSTHSAFKSARAIIKGDSDKKMVFDQAMEYLADDYSMRVGEVENFIQMSAGFIQSVDLENGVYEQDALEKFEEWEKKADNLMLGSGESNPLHNLSTAPAKVPAFASRTSSTEGSGTFTDLFDKDH